MPPFVAVTPGEPAGIGPEICIKLLEFPLSAVPVLFADRRIIQAAMQTLDRRSELIAWQPDAPHQLPNEGQILFHQVDAAVICDAGSPDSDNATYLLECLALAGRYCLSGHLAALVTGPLNKAVINQAGITFTGHTEYLAQLCGCDQVVMMLASDKMRVTLVTTHLPLSEVPAAVTRDRLEFTIRTTHQALRDRFGLESPKIQVLGLNPHAGEDGQIGTEEITIITPLLEKLRQQGMTLSGPVPADTAFNTERLSRCDAVVAMYHDQGLPVLKHASFGQAVNITLGLPIIRTSVDHGTAFDLAGKGLADPGSLITAFEMACTMSST